VSPSWERKRIGHDFTQATAKTIVEDGDLIIASGPRKPSNASATSAEPAGHMYTTPESQSV